MKDDVQRIEAILGEEREQLQETQAYKSELEDAQAHDRDLLAKTKSKLASIRTSKEYMATQREFETNRKLTSDREDEISKLDVAIKEKEAVIAEKEQQLDELRSHVADEAKETEGRLVDIEATAKGQRAVREQKSEAIQKGLLRKYDRIRRVRQGTAVVPATDGVCTGCRMQLPPQLYNILQRQESIEQCPNCQRIVFYVPEAGEDEEAASA
jgi:predicted  nucleic acid-binding Zn-ribbon protein